MTLLLAIIVIVLLFGGGSYATYGLYPALGSGIGIGGLLLVVVAVWMLAGR